MAKSPLKAVQLIDRPLTDLSFDSGKSEADLADALIKRAKNWDDNPSEKTREAQERLTLSIKIGRVAAAFCKERKAKLPRGVDWVQYALAQWDAPVAKRHGDFVRHRNAAANYVSYLLRVTYLPSAAKTGRKRGTKNPKAPKAPKVVPVQTAKPDIERPVFSPSHIPVFQSEDQKKEAREWTRGFLAFFEETCAANEVFKDNFVNLQQTIHRLFKAMS